MRQIKLITDYNNQKTTVLMPDGGKFDMYLQYKARQIGWFMSIVYNDKTINNIRVVTSGNFLHQWRNILPFGLACTTEASQEPMLQKDFSEGRSKIFVLSQEEVNEYARVVSGQIST